MITACIFASMLVTQQAPARIVNETGVDFNYPGVKFDQPVFTAPSDVLKFNVYVSDIDVRVLKNNKTGELKATAYYSGGHHTIVIDPKHRGATAFGDTKYISQDQISVKNAGWTEDKEFFIYEVTVNIPESDQVPGQFFVAALEVRDDCPAPWERDRSQFCGATLGFKRSE